MKPAIANPITLARIRSSIRCATRFRRGGTGCTTSRGHRYHLWPSSQNGDGACQTARITPGKLIGSNVLKFLRSLMTRLGVQESGLFPDRGIELVDAQHGKAGSAQGGPDLWWVQCVWPSETSLSIPTRQVLQRFSRSLYSVLNITRLRTSVTHTHRYSVRYGSQDEDAAHEAEREQAAFEVQQSPRSSEAMRERGCLNSNAFTPIIIIN